jgi:hypothetical protein
MNGVWPWLALVGLGAFHGINPAMGWLFAVGLGLQARSGGAVVRALGPIALGHALSIATVVAVVVVAGSVVDPVMLRLVAAVLLVGFGGYRVVRGYRHKFRIGMVAGFSDLVVWSFLMATAHGAGLMLAPVLLMLLLSPGAGGDLHAHAAMLLVLGDSLWVGLLAVAVHTLSTLAVTGMVAWVVYDWIGLAILRRGWINVDFLWDGALVGTGLALLVNAGLAAASNRPNEHRVFGQSASGVPEQAQVAPKYQHLNMPVLRRFHA